MLGVPKVPDPEIESGCSGTLKSDLGSRNNVLRHFWGTHIIPAGLVIGGRGGKGPLPPPIGPLHARILVLMGLRPPLTKSF